MTADSTRKRGLLPIAIVLITSVSFGVAAILSVWYPPPDVPAVDAPNLAFPLPYIAFAMTGAFIIWRHPGHRVGWVMAAIGVSLCTGLALISVGRWLDRQPGGTGVVGAGVFLTGQTLITLSFSLVIVLLLVFPTGAFANRFWRGLFWVVVAIATLTSLVTIVQFPVLRGDDTIENPFRVDLPPEFGLLQGLTSFAVYGGVLVGAAVSPLLRFRRADSETRLQLKWFVFGVVSAATLTLVDGLVQLLLPDVVALDSLATALYSLAWIAAIVGIGLAVLRYRLWAIDLVISRTLTYAALVAVIVLVYTTIAAVVGSMFGQAAGVPIAVLATAATSIALQPARARLQQVANRLVYGQRASSYDALADFTDRVARSLTVEQVAPRMARALAEVTLAEEAAVWLDTGWSRVLAATWPPDRPARGVESATRTAPVEHEHATLALLAVWRRSGEMLSAVEQRLMDDLARQASLILRGVALDAELRRSLDELRGSRRRLVEAQDRERRCLERDLHDGAQQALVALSVSLGLEAQVTTDPAQVDRLERLRCEAVAALETLRDLARGLAPPLLEAEGLASALGALARRATFHVDVQADGSRFKREIESAVYFCCAEALQNVSKHAHASAATIRISEHDSQVCFDVIDDGQGFDTAGRLIGAGLQNMRDRLEVLGGQLVVESSVNGGTRVAGRVPL